MKELNEQEKRTLSSMLKSKIKETHDLEDVIQNELTVLTENSTVELIKEILASVYEQRQNCYEIARKLDIN